MMLTQDTSNGSTHGQSMMQRVDIPPRNEQNKIGKRDKQINTLL